MILEFDVFGDVQFSRDLLRFRDRAMDMRPAFASIHASFLAIERHQFATSGGFSGGWRPLAPSTVEAKERRGLDPRILRATDAMWKSLTTASHPAHVFDNQPDTLFMGTRVKSAKSFPYPATHQHGTRNRRVPQRRIVELTETHRRRWVRIMQRYVVGAALDQGASAA